MQSLSAQQMQDYMPPFPKLARGNGTIKVSSPPHTLQEMINSIQHWNPKSGVKAAPTFGRLQGFKPMRVPVVFHCELLMNRGQLGDMEGGGEGVHKRATVCTHVGAG